MGNTDPELEPELDLAPLPAAGPAATAATTAPKRVLIVDDEPDFTLMAGLTLEQTGRYVTRQENDALEALSAAREFRPDLVLLDVMMPDLDGGDVLAQLQADPATRDTPVIFLTALVGGDEAPAGSLPSGGHSFIPKPVDLEVLVRRIEEALAGA